MINDKKFIKDFINFDLLNSAEQTNTKEKFFEIFDSLHFNN